MAMLKLIRGYPGSGKSFASHVMFPGFLLLENDMYLIQDGEYKWSPEQVKEAINWCMKMTKIALENSMSVVVANTFTKRRYIEAYKKIADKYGAKLEVYRCIGDFRNVHGLSDEKVQSFKDAMEDWPGEIIVTPVNMHPIEKTDDVV